MLHSYCQSQEITNWIKGLIRTNNLIVFYKSNVWRKKRLFILDRDNYECQECKKQGLVTTKVKLDIHHIKELKDNPELALDDGNLVTVCVYHHNLLDNRIKTKEKEFDNEERW